jgi:hypothetical protein
MTRERALKVVMVLNGANLFSQCLPLTQSNQPKEQMLGGIYTTLGHSLLLARRSK